MKTKLLTAMIVCALLISLTGCAADKIASTPTQNVDVTMDTETAIESEGETEAVTLAAETAEKDIPAQPASNGGTADKRDSGTCPAKRIGSSETDRIAQAIRADRGSEARISEPAR